MESILQKSVTLSELVDLASFQEVCQSFVELYRIAIKVFDASGAKLVDAKVPDELCGYVFTFAPGRQQCTALVNQIKSFAPESPEVTEFNCFTGQRYKIVPVYYDHDCLGKLVYGPYIPAEQNDLPASVTGLDVGIDAAKLRASTEQIRRVAEPTIQRILDNLKKVVDVILFTSYKGLLTSNMHIESITESYNELQEKNRQLKESYERLKELDKLKSNFLATVSHELRTPLTSVIGYSEMLLEGLAGDLNNEQREYISTIMEKGDNLLQLITGILDISKIESGTLKFSISETRLDEIIESSLSSVRPQAVKGGITLAKAVSADLPPIQADRDKIRQVIVNLLGNAVKFTPKGGRITVSAETIADGDAGMGGAQFNPFEALAPRWVKICVSDTGIGIPKDNLDKVFETFYQVDNSSTREFGGTGLGLSIVKNFVESHGGHVSVDSEVGVGSTFTLVLPVDGKKPEEVPVLVDDTRRASAAGVGGERNASVTGYGKR
ncbi:MAG: PocR ligand-binding domain-containing protein [Deltaproteobacteria bacterium]|nr:PocR ligand-binding domain-containing protein [Deltaproteobacteria bacterium]